MPRCQRLFARLCVPTHCVYAALLKMRLKHHMRFSNAFTQPLPVRDPAADAVRRLLAAPGHDAPAAPQPERELPQDLDQRVREIGEW